MLERYSYQIIVIVEEKRVISFSKKCKQELGKQPFEARHCAVAELAGMLAAGGRIEKEDNIKLIIQSDNTQVVKRAEMLLESIFKKKASDKERKLIIPVQGRKSLYYVMSSSEDELKSCLEALKLHYDKNFNVLFDRIVTQNTCCKRAFARGAFLASGSVSAPEKTYHFEIVFINRKTAEDALLIINSLGVEAKLIVRKKYYVIYLKEGSYISDMLGIMGASISMMDFENVRILKEVRNSVNRQVNCETANISKTVIAASRQIEDIKLIKKYYGFNKLKPALREIAELRLENPDMPLKELGEMLNPPVGKSGVNHRLNKLKELAQNIKDQLENIKEEACGKECSGKDTYKQRIQTGGGISTNCK